jgi:hypothetical protein
MPSLEALAFHDGRGSFRPRGRYSLVDAVDLISNAIAHCRERSVSMLLIDATGFVDLSVPTLVDRFLMVEDWAREAEGLVIVAMVAPVEYIHPRKFGVQVALNFGLICDVYSSEEEASAWLSQTSSNASRINE